MLKLKRKKSGQSIVEYALLFTIVISIIFVFLRSTFAPKFQSTLQTASGGMAEMGNLLGTSRHISTNTVP